MATLAKHANNVLGLLGYLPDCLADLEDAANAFLRSRRLYWQQLGMSSMDIKVRSVEIDLSARTRDFELEDSLSNAFPAFVELAVDGRSRVPVDVIPLEDVIDHEGERALALYGSPNGIRLAWDAWNDGRLYFFYEPGAAIENLTIGSSIDFPEAFLDMIEAKAAWSLVSVAQGNEAAESYRTQRPLNVGLIESLKALKMDFAITVTQWENEFRVWRFSANEERSYERRADDEIPSSRGVGFYDDEVSRG